MNAIVGSGGFAQAERMIRGLGMIRCTLVWPGDPVRFERSFHTILEPWKLAEPYAGYIGIKFDKDVEPRFELRKKRTIFFNPVSREWIGEAVFPENALRFSVEVSSLIYNYRDYFDPASWVPDTTWHDTPIESYKNDPAPIMDTLGLAISGYNVRAILFKKICNGEWSGGYDRLTIHTVKGAMLANLIAGILEKDTVVLTAAERSVLERYLAQRAAFET